MSMRSFNRIPRREQKAIKDDVVKIGALFQARRKELGFTQEEFAERLGLNVNSVKYIEQGRRIPSLPMLFRIAKALKIDVILKKHN
jgi:transcriptional regulator with XRE-family HTH domain